MVSHGIPIGTPFFVLLFNHLLLLIVPPNRLVRLVNVFVVPHVVGGVRIADMESNRPEETTRKATIKVTFSLLYVSWLCSAV